MIDVSDGESLSSSNSSSSNAGSNKSDDSSNFGGSESDNSDLRSDVSEMIMDDLSYNKIPK